MKQVSASLAEQLALYRAIRLQYLERFPKCRASLKGCQYWACQIHHKKGRGKYLLVLETWLGVCPSCHQRIELNPYWAKQNGLSEERLKDDIDLIGYEDIINLK